MARTPPTPPSNPCVRLGQLWRHHSRGRIAEAEVLDVEPGRALLGQRWVDLGPGQTMPTGSWELAADLPQSMATLLPLVGSSVALRRGTDTRTEGPGRLRTVQAVLLKVSRHLVQARLLQDDPDATTGPTRAGDIGTWYGHSFIALPDQQGHA